MGSYCPAGSTANSINELDSLHATGQALQQSQGTVQAPQISGSSSVANMQVNESKTSVQGDYKVRGETILLVHTLSLWVLLC